MKRIQYFSILSFTATVLLHQAFSSEPVGRCAGKSEKWLDLGGNFCYIVDTNNTGTWMEAVNKCFREGGSLGSFHSDEEVQRLVSYASSETVGFYIGLWKSDGNSLSWVDKTPVDYENWYPGEPNLSFERCVEMYIDSGMWNDRKCDERFGYICSSPKNPVLPSTGLRKGCIGKWQDLGGDNCYIIETEKTFTRRGAARRCEEADGHLASFHSIEEISAVLQRTKGYTKGLYIGLQIFGGVHSWDDTSPMDFTYFKSKDDDYRLQNKIVVCFLMNQQNGKWYKTDCGRLAGYICSSPKVIVGMEVEPFLREMSDRLQEMIQNAQG